MNNPIPIKKDKSLNLIPLTKDRRFGTDGIRGPVDSTMNPLFVTKLGWAAGAVLLEEVDQIDDPEDKKEQPPENLLIEPDMPSDDEEQKQKEASAVGAAGAPSGKLAGSTSPLGRDSSYPAKKKKKKKAAAPSGGLNWYLPKK